jgi:hypothetical protein
MATISIEKAQLLAQQFAAHRTTQIKMVERMESNRHPYLDQDITYYQQRDLKTKLENYYASGKFLTNPLNEHIMELLAQTPHKPDPIHNVCSQIELVAMATQWLSNTNLKDNVDDYVSVTLNPEQLAQAFHVADVRTEENKHSKNRREYERNKHSLIPDDLANRQTVLCEYAAALFLSQLETDPVLANQYANSVPTVWAKEDHQAHKHEGDIGHAWEVRSMRWETKQAGVKPKDLHIGRNIIVAKPEPAKDASGKFVRVEGTKYWAVGDTVRIYGFIPALTAWFLGSVLAYNTPLLTRGIKPQYLSLTDIHAALPQQAIAA